MATRIITSALARLLDDATLGLAALIGRRPAPAPVAVRRSRSRSRG